MADDDDLPPVIEEEPEPGINVMMPSDLSAEARAPSGIIVRQLTEEERQRYPVERPTREDLLVARAAGLNTLDVARQFGKSLAYVEGVARHYRIGIKAGRPDPERRTLRRKIEEEMATKKVVAEGEETNAVSRQSEFDDRLTKEFLEVEIQRRSANGIAKAVGCSENTVTRYLRKYGIKNPWTPSHKPPRAAVESPATEIAAPPVSAAPASSAAKEPRAAAASAAPQPPLPTWSGKARYHKLIDGMLDELPPPSEGWTPEGAARWIGLMSQVVLRIYRLDTQPRSDPAA